MTFRTVLSEARMDKVINAIRLSDEISGQSGRPDIGMIFSADPEDSTPVDVVVIEIKEKTSHPGDHGVLAFKQNQWMGPGYPADAFPDRVLSLITDGSLHAGWKGTGTTHVSLSATSSSPPVHPWDAGPTRAIPRSAR